MLEKLTPFALGVAAAAVIGAIGFVHLSRTPESPTAAETVPRSRRAPGLRPSPITPIPVVDDVDPKAAALGRRLFHDELLSRDRTISCASCHDIERGGDDGRSTSTGVGGRRGTLNAPTVLNSRFNFRQFWDGRAEDLEEQIDGPLQHPFEMDMTWTEVLARLRADDSYVEAFRGAYDADPSPELVRHAIAEFERSLVTPDGAFDRYLWGDDGALSPEARRGYEVFVSVGCSTCHQGVNAGGNMFQPLGRMRPFFKEGAGERERDQGRFGVTGREPDRGVFKVPSLRNVALTAPYFHDGSVETLEEAVRLMGRYQLGIELDGEQVASLVAFLDSLSGEIPTTE